MKYGYNNAGYSDDIQQTRWSRQDSGPKNSAQTGKANHQGGDMDGRGGGKSSGHKGINNPDNEVKVNKKND